MKKFIAAIAATCISIPVFANTSGHTVQDHYKDVTRKIPVTESVCEDREIPVQRESFSTGKAVIGGIIGGIIGHNLGGKSNRHVTASFGTLAGSVLGGHEVEAAGTRTQTDCRNVTRYHQQTESVYSHSTITFTENGRTFTVRFQK